MATELTDAALLNRLTAQAQLALSHWDVPRQVPQLLKFRENAVFKIRLGSGEAAALRIHRAGYHDAATLASELQLMAHLRAGGLSVPAPIFAKSGEALVPAAAADDHQSQYADVVSWVAGKPLGASGQPLPYAADELAAIFHRLGSAMADLHRLTDGWQTPHGFVRPHWNAAGLLGDAPLWGRFWDCAGLEAKTAHRLIAIRRHLAERLAAVTRDDLDYGIIHADLVRENVFVHEGDVQLIDFDDSGYGWRMFDIATALLKHRDEPTYELIEESLLAGYQAKRRLDAKALTTLPLFLVLRSLTYIGWAAARWDEPGNDARLQRYCQQSLQLAADVLGL